MIIPSHRFCAVRFGGSRGGYPPFDDVLPSFRHKSQAGEGVRIDDELGILCVD